MPIKQIFTIFVALVLVGTACYAEEPRTVGVYKRHLADDKHQQRDNDHTFHHMLYLSGVGDGYMVINRRLQAAEQQILYCQPEAETMNGAEYMKVLEKALHRPDQPIADQLTIAEALLLALKEEFPCL